MHSGNHVSHQILAAGLPTEEGRLIWFQMQLGNTEKANVRVTSPRNAITSENTSTLVFP
jgi:hypothetical protein